MIYLDMDGVLADFDASCLAQGVVNRSDFIHKPKSEFNAEELELDRQVVELMSKPGFFENMQVMEGAIDLWNTAWKLDAVRILTARPSTTSPGVGDRVKNEKLAWCYKHLPGFTSEHFHCVIRHQKQEYAVSTYYNGSREDILVESFEVSNLLVDDLVANCEEWAKAGGKAILFKNAIQAIDELEKFCWAM